MQKNPFIYDPKEKGGRWGRPESPLTSAGKEMLPWSISITPSACQLWPPNTYLWAGDEFASFLGVLLEKTSCPTFVTSH